MVASTTSFNPPSLPVGILGPSGRPSVFVLDNLLTPSVPAIGLGLMKLLVNPSGSDSIAMFAHNALECVRR